MILCGDKKRAITKPSVRKNVYDSDNVSTADVLPSLSGSDGQFIRQPEA